MLWSCVWSALLQRFSLEQTKLFMLFAAFDPVMWSVCSLDTCWNLKVQMKIIQFLQFLHLDCAELQRLLPFPYGILKISPSLRMPSLPIELCCSGASFLSMSSFSVQDWMKSLFWLPEQGLAQLGSWQSFVCAALALFRMWLFLRLSFCYGFLPMSCTEPFLQFPLLCWLWDEFALCDSAHEEWGLWRWDRFLWAARHLPKTAALSIRLPWTLWLSSILNEWIISGQ